MNHIHQNPPEGIFLIIHADDWGIHKAVNKALHALIHRRAITSASLLAGGKEAAEARRFAALHRHFCTGVHLSLSPSQSPLAPPQDIPSLTDGQDRFRNPLSALEASGDPGEMLLEMKAQIRFLLEAGIHPTHLDSHQGCLLGLGLHSGSERLFPVIRQLCLDYRLPFKMPRQVVQAELLPQEMRFRLGGLAAWLEEQHLPVIDDLIVPEYGLMPGEDYESYKEGILRALMALQPGTVAELTLHPALPDDHMKEAEAHWIKREWEYRIVLDGDFSHMLRSRGITPVSWSSLRR